MNAKDYEFKTPLDLAVQYKSVSRNFRKVAKFLMEKMREQENEDIPEEIVSVSTKSPCVICLAPRNGIYVLSPCGHASMCKFCCISIILQDNPKCPTCRKPAQIYMKIFFQEVETD